MDVQPTEDACMAETTHAHTSLLLEHTANAVAACILYTNESFTAMQLR